MKVEAVSYDSVGNRDPSTWTYDVANRLANDGTFTYTYDLNGNQVARSDGHTYTYEPENQLVQVTFPGTTASYTYDGLDRRIQKTVNGASTRYIYNHGDILSG